MFVAWVFHLWPRTWGKMMQNHCLFEVIVHDDFHKMHLYELAIYWITQRICHGVTCIAERWVGQGWFGEFEGVLWELCAGGVHQDGPTISRMWFPEWFKATRDNLEWLYSLKQACHVKMDPWKKQIQNKTWYLGSTLVFQSVSYSNCWWLFFAINNDSTCCCTGKSKHQFEESYKQELPMTLSLEALNSPQVWSLNAFLSTKKRPSSCLAARQKVLSQVSLRLLNSVMCWKVEICWDF